MGWCHRGVPFGSPSLETLVPITYHEGISERGLPPSWFARVLSENPARLFGLYPRKGTIQPGSDADLLVIDPDAEWTIAARDLIGRAGLTPYAGRRVRGRPWMTFLRGEMLLRDGELVAEPGLGQYLPARARWRPWQDESSRSAAAWRAEPKGTGRRRRQTS